MWLIFPLIILLVGCKRSPEMIGIEKTYFELDCLKTKSDLAPGLSASGNMTFSITSSCLLAQCYQKSKRLGAYPWHDRVLWKKKAEVESCL